MKSIPVGFRISPGLYEHLNRYQDHKGVNLSKQARDDLICWKLHMMQAELEMANMLTLKEAYVIYDCLRDSRHSWNGDHYLNLPQLISQRIPHPLLEQVRELEPIQAYILLHWVKLFASNRDQTPEVCARIFRCSGNSDE